MEQSIRLAAQSHIGPSLPGSFPRASPVQALVVSPLGTLLEAATASVPIQRRLWTFQLISEAQHASGGFLDQKPSLVSSYAEEVPVKPSPDNPGTHPPAADGSLEEKLVRSGLRFKAELLVCTSPNPSPSPLFRTHTRGYCFWTDLSFPDICLLGLSLPPKRRPPLFCAPLNSQL